MAEGKEGRRDNKLIEKGGEEVKKYYNDIYTSCGFGTPLFTWQSSNRKAHEADLLLRSHPLVIFS